MNSSSAKRYLPWVVATTMFMEQLDSTILNTAVPSMAVSLHVTPLSLKSVVTSYIISLAVCIPISGWMADRFGSRRVFASAVAVFTMASIACGFAINVHMLVAARIRIALDRGVQRNRHGAGIAFVAELGEVDRDGSGPIGPG